MLELYIRVKNRIREAEEGASAVEYGLLVALIAAVIVVAVALLGTTLNDIFTNTNTKITPPKAT